MASPGASIAGIVRHPFARPVNASPLPATFARRPAAGPVRSDSPAFRPPVSRWRTAAAVGFAGRTGFGHFDLAEMAADFAGFADSSAIAVAATDSAVTADFDFVAIDCFAIVAGSVVSGVHTTFSTSHHRDTV